MSEHDWVTAAMADDSLVAELLLRLRLADPTQPVRKVVPPPQLEWSVRQRRSKQIVRKKADPARASPTTPLSWSGATSVSGGAADGVEESSQPSKLIENPRSRVVATSETTQPKRSRKKKTLAELKDAESLLLKEERNLKNQLATLRRKIEKERATNERLKRMKLDILSHQNMETVRASPTSHEAMLNQHSQMEIPCGPSKMILPANGACNKVEPSLPNRSSKAEEDGSEGSSFLLPDLNLPFDNNLGFGIL